MSLELGARKVERTWPSTATEEQGMTEDEETRLRAVEEFIAEIRGGKKFFLWLCAVVGSLGGGGTLLAVFWERFSGPS